MIETTYDHAAAATRLATLVDTTRTGLSATLPASAVRPLFSTTEAGAIVNRAGATVREPVQRKPAPGAVST